MTEHSVNEAIPIIEFQNICKAFSGVMVLKHVSFKIRRGSIHCLLGENGAGKSTLIKILTGVYKADSGKVLIDGNEVHVNSIEQAQQLGIGTVFQENSLIPHLSVAENIFLTREPKLKNGFIDYRRMFKESEAWAEKLGVKINPRAKVKALSVAEQQIVEIVKVFSRNPRIVILDEPTSSLSDKEISRLFSIVKKMQESGITFIYVSHRMEEIKEIGDQGSILRDGEFIITIEDIKKAKLNDIIKYIVGRELTQQYPLRNARIGKTIFEVKNLGVANMIHDISFQLRAGEVLGFSGLVGSGRTETAKTIFGVYHKTTGEVILRGKNISINNPSDAIRAGIGLVPENRKEEGLFLGKSVAWNISFASLDKIKRGLFLDLNRERALVNKYVQDLNIKTSNIEKPVKSAKGSFFKMAFGWFGNLYF